MCGRVRNIRLCETLLEFFVDVFEAMALKLWNRRKWICRENRDSNAEIQAILQKVNHKIKKPFKGFFKQYKAFFFNFLILHNTEKKYIIN